MFLGLQVYTIVVGDAAVAEDGVAVDTVVAAAAAVDRKVRVPI